MARKVSRQSLILGTFVVLGAVLTFAFWPRPLMVDMGEVKRGPMVVTINEEAKTRVRDTFVVSTPVAGRLLRVDLEPGDRVFEGKSVLARMLPANPVVLDVRSRAQAIARVTAAEAALRLAHAGHNRAIADKELADAELGRTRSLRKDSTVSQSTLDRAVREARAAAAALHTAEAAIAVSEAELVDARAQLIDSDDDRPESAGSTEAITIRAPVTGSVLRVTQESESTLAAGTAIMELGNVDGDLEVLVELLSSDAVQVDPGDRVIFDSWGGPGVLNGVVERIDPWGFTKVSALGVEEQRVNTIVRFTDPPEARKRLGDGFRVEAQIVVWEDDDVLIVPSSALFREGGKWAIFVVEDGVAKFRQVDIDQNNGVDAQVLGGLKPGERVILYPSSELADGTRVTERDIK